MQVIRYTKNSLAYQHLYDRTSLAEGPFHHSLLGPMSIIHVLKVILSITGTPQARAEQYRETAEPLRNGEFSLLIMVLQNAALPYCLNPFLAGYTNKQHICTSKSTRRKVHNLHHSTLCTQWCLLAGQASNLSSKRCLKPQRLAYGKTPPGMPPNVGSHSSLFS